MDCLRAKIPEAFSPRVERTRNSLTAYIFLRKLKKNYGVRAIVADRAPWYGVAPDLGLRLIHDRDLLNLAERLSKEVKRRLKDFDLYFPCRCKKPFSHASKWLEAWKGYYNYVRHHMALRKAPCGSSTSEPLSMLSLLKEVMWKA